MKEKRSKLYNNTQLTVEVSWILLTYFLFGTFLAEINGQELWIAVAITAEKENRLAKYWN